MDIVSYKFYGNLRRWRVPWIIGIVLLILSLYLQRKLYYSYIYFFIAGIITLPIESSGWGNLCDKGMLIRFGILNLSKIFIKWSEIDRITTITERYHYLHLWAGAIRDDKGYEIQSIAIIFNSAIPENILKSINHFRIRMLFGQTIYLKGDDTLVLNTEPECGVSNFYEILSAFTKVEAGELSDEQDTETITIKKSLNLFDAILLIVPAILPIIGDKIS